jgi:hypothetical protein
MKIWQKKIITDTLHEDQNKFLVISGSVLLRMKNVTDKKNFLEQNH